jgi:hypothetical protein
VVADLHPVLVEGVAIRAVAAPGVLGGTEDELGLLLREVGAAADQGERGDQRRRAAYF